MAARAITNFEALSNAKLAAMHAAGGPQGVRAGVELRKRQATAPSGAVKAVHA